MKTVIFNKNDYESFKDFYKDAAIKLDNIKNQDYYDTATFDNDPNVLLEFLFLQHGYIDNPITIILCNFDLEKIKQQKTYDNYEWNIILEVLQEFVQDFPNNQLIIE